MNKTKSGFTIVELLIVIVVIGILAAITIVAYNGIQARGKDAQMVSAMQQYYKGLVSYAAINGSYPAYSYACLSDAGGTCWTGNGINTGFTDALKTVMGSSLPVSPSGVERPLYLGTSWGWTVDGQPRAFILYQADPAIPKCNFGPAASGVAPNLSSTVPATYSSASDPGALARECRIPLPAV